MKFKTKEELMKTYNPECDNEKIGYDIGIYDAFKSFAERVEFYKKYKDWDWCKELETQWKERKEKYIGKWNDWLFDYCFGDVIG